MVFLGTGSLRLQIFCLNFTFLVGNRQEPALRIEAVKMGNSPVPFIPNGNYPPISVCLWYLFSAIWYLFFKFYPELVVFICMGTLPIRITLSERNLNRIIILDFTGFIRWQQGWNWVLGPQGKKKTKSLFLRINFEDSTLMNESSPCDVSQLYEVFIWDNWNRCQEAPGDMG